MNNVKLRPAGSRRKALNNNTILLMMTIALFVIMYAAGCIVYSSKGFARLQSFIDILKNNAGLICATCGMTAVMITGGIDISVGSLIAMNCMFLSVGIENWGLPAELLLPLMGLDVKKTRFKAHVFCSFMASIGSICYVMNTMCGTTRQALGLEMDSIASAVIGGTLLTGGVGNVFGSFIGVLINGTISSLVKTNGKLNSAWPNVITALLLCFFIVIQAVFARLKKKNRA